VSSAAVDLAGGRLDTRLDDEGDADLESLVRSFNDMAVSLQQRIEREARFASDVSHSANTTDSVHRGRGPREADATAPLAVDVLGHRSGTRATRARSARSRIDAASRAVGRRRCKAVQRSVADDVEPRRLTCWRSPIGPARRGW
jgi:methyl-accepting chemotaxis protein